MILKVEPYLFLFLIFLFLCLLFYCFVFSVYFPWVFSVSGCLDVDVEAPGSFRATGFVDLQGFFLRLSEGLSVMYLLEAELEGSGSDADWLTDCGSETEHTVSALTLHFLCGERGGPPWGLPAQPQAFFYPDRQPTLSPRPPLFSSLLSKNQGYVSHWKRVPEPAASTQTQLLSCMIIRSSRENGRPSFFFFFLLEPRFPPNPTPSDKDLFGHLLRAQQRLA